MIEEGVAFTYTVKRATIKDAVPIARLALTLTYPGDGNGYLLGKYNVEEIETFIKGTNVDVWVVSNDSHIEGFAIIKSSLIEEVLETKNRTVLFNEMIKNANNVKYVVAIAATKGNGKQKPSHILYSYISKKYADQYVYAFVCTAPQINLASLNFHKKFNFSIVAEYIKDFAFGIRDYRSVLLILPPSKTVTQYTIESI